MLQIDAIAFDLDGTLYPNYRLYTRLVPFLLREYRFLMAMGRARDQLRATNRSGDFYELQAQLMAEILGEDPSAVKERTERLIYRGWERHFRRIKLFPYVREALAAFRSEGLKTAVLSDFPPETKLDHLGLAEGWDAKLCSERVGRLKPAPESFLELARTLGTVPERVLYVGNSVKYDVVGAAGVGMRTALVTRFPRRDSGADFIFSDYRQLQRFVLS